MKTPGDIRVSFAAYKKVDGSDGYLTYQSLSKLLGQKVVDLVGYATLADWGEYEFSVVRVLLEDGSSIGLHGAHDFVCLEPLGHTPAGLEPEQLEYLAEHEDS